MLKKTLTGLIVALTMPLAAQSAWKTIEPMGDQLKEIRDTMATVGTQISPTDVLIEGPILHQIECNRVRIQHSKMVSILYKGLHDDFKPIVNGMINQDYFEMITYIKSDISFNNDMLVRVSNPYLIQLIMKADDIYALYLKNIKQLYADSGLQVF